VAGPAAQTALVGQRQGVSTWQGVVQSAVPVATLFMQLSPPQRVEAHNWVGQSVPFQQFPWRLGAGCRAREIHCACH